VVLATGFRVDRFVRPMEVIGRDRAALDDAWKGGPYAYMAISVPGFPTSHAQRSQRPVGNFSLIEVAELQLAYILQLVERVRSGACDEICAFDRFREEMSEPRLADFVTS